MTPLLPRHAISRETCSAPAPGFGLRTAGPLERSREMRRTPFRTRACVGARGHAMRTRPHTNTRPHHTHHVWRRKTMAAAARCRRPAADGGGGATSEMEACPQLRKTTSQRAPAVWYRLRAARPPPPGGNRAEQCMDGSVHARTLVTNGPNVRTDDLSRAHAAAAPRAA